MADRTQSGPEHRARTTVIAILATAQNGTSGVLAGGKHARRRVAWATPRTGDRGRPAKCRGTVDSMSMHLADDGQVGVLPFDSDGPNAHGWVVEVMFSSSRRSDSGRPLYWHGPPTCDASNLNESVAVFTDAGSASHSFQRCCLPLPIWVTRWEAISVQEAVTRDLPLPAAVGWASGRQVAGQ